MISCKHITKIVGVMMAVAVVFCFWLMAFSQEAVETLGGVKVQMEYESALFDTEQPMQVDIQMEQGQWEEENGRQLLKEVEPLLTERERRADYLYGERLKG